MIHCRLRFRRQCDKKYIEPNSGECVQSLVLHINDDTIQSLFVTSVFPAKYKLFEIKHKLIFISYILTNTFLEYDSMCSFNIMSIFLLRF